MEVILAIDPGEVHCGTAWFVDGECTSSEELSPAGLLLMVEQAVVNELVDVVVVEEFRLYPWKAQEQAFSQLKTIEVIGALRYIVARFGTAQWVEQGAMIKKPTRAQLKARGIKSVPGSIHCKDAQLHGWHYLLRKAQNA